MTFSFLCFPQCKLSTSLRTNLPNNLTVFFFNALAMCAVPSSVISFFPRYKYWSVYTKERAAIGKHHVQVKLYLTLLFSRPSATAFAPASWILLFQRSSRISVYNKKKWAKECDNRFLSDNERCMFFYPIVILLVFTDVHAHIL